MFALETLHRVGISVDHFATVMTNLELYYAEPDADDAAELLVTKIEQKDSKPDEASLIDFLSTHPGTDERIKLVKEFKLMHPANKSEK